LEINKMATLVRVAQRRKNAAFRHARELEARGLVRQRIEAVRGAQLRIDGRWKIAFTSAHYLGLNRHPRLARALVRAAHAWGISLGMPPALGAGREVPVLENKLARLAGQESALLYPSTTHLALDVIPLLAGKNSAVFVDAWAYPVSLEGVAAARQRGAQVLTFPHNDCHALAGLLDDHADVRDKLIVCDGVYPSDGRLANLNEIDRLAGEYGAAVYVDDAHGLGVLGESPTRMLPYGRGGGGTARFLGVEPGNILYAASLSKALGVPLAFAAGPSAFIDYLRTVTPAHEHSSPPALPLVHAALEALRLHARFGDRLRARLANNVRRFREGVARTGARLVESHLFPLQSVSFSGEISAEAVGSQLLQHGIWAVVQAPSKDHPEDETLLFVLTAFHTEMEIEQAAETLGQILHQRN
jgi:8-amino-7-oxononanoate synthase